MKVKKLDWAIINDTTLVSRNKLYSINVLSDCKVIISNAFQSASYSENIEEAKESCQSHYESFILSQIEPDPVKEFDPTLLGFRELKIENYFEGLDENVLEYVLGDLSLSFCTITKTWCLFREKEDSYESLILFEALKIPDHDFGVKLLNQFVEVE
jgi:hypothetical protein